MPKSIPENSNFVVVGAWNPAIFSPRWLKRCFNDQVPDEVPASFSIGTELKFKIMLEEFTLEPTKTHLTFYPNKLDSETCQAISKMAVGVADQLSHTPITASGSNFLYQLLDGDELKTDIIGRIKGVNELLGSVLGNKVISSLAELNLQTEDCISNIRVANQDDSNATIINVNFEYVGGADQMKKGAQNIMRDFEMSKRVISALVK